MEPKIKTENNKQLHVTGWPGITVSAEFSSTKKRSVITLDIAMIASYNWRCFLCQQSPGSASEGEFTSGNPKVCNYVMLGLF